MDNTKKPMVIENVSNIDYFVYVIFMADYADNVIYL